VPDQYGRPTPHLATPSCEERRLERISGSGRELSVPAAGWCLARRHAASACSVQLDWRAQVLKAEHETTSTRSAYRLASWLLLLPTNALDSCALDPLEGEPVRPLPGRGCSLLLLTLPPLPHKSSSSARCRPSHPSLLPTHDVPSPPHPALRHPTWHGALDCPRHLLCHPRLYPPSYVRSSLHQGVPEDL